MPSLNHDQVEDLVLAFRSIAKSITASAGPGEGIDGSRIESLTEAVMDVALGLQMIASAIESTTEGRT